MKKIFLLIILLAGSRFAVAQTETELPDEIMMEGVQPAGDEIIIDNDNRLQQLQLFRQHPANLNNCTVNDLAALGVENPLLQAAFFDYRSLLGPFVSTYELQAVPGWSATLIRRLLPYITVKPARENASDWWRHLRAADRYLFMKASQTPERSVGYQRPDSGGRNYYQGSPLGLQLRCRIMYKQMLQAGILAEKDPGEQFFKGKQKAGFDFYSFHVFIKKPGMLRSLAIGDFSVCMGQGLIQWGGFAFGMGADAINIKRTAPLLQPYHSAGEINFQRGVGAELAKGKWQGAAFVSMRRLDANLVSDTVQYMGRWISALQSSGYHRTLAEQGDKAAVRKITLGASLGFRAKRFHLRLNWISSRLSLPLQVSADLYKLFEGGGRLFNNFSLDYAFTRRNWHFFGETAIDRNFNIATLNGLLANLSANAAIALLFRRLPAGYSSPGAATFSETSDPVNENGIYVGITLKASERFMLSGYADFFSHPWLRYRVNKPVPGAGYLLRVQYTPSRQLNMEASLRFRKSSINYNTARYTFSPVLEQLSESVRFQLNYLLSNAFTIRYRLEAQWFDYHGHSAEQGLLSYLDLGWRIKKPSVNANLRLQYFETGGYNSRIYAFENAMIYDWAITAFYGYGYRLYMSSNFNVTRHLRAYLHTGIALYPHKELISSGLDEIKGGKKTTLKLGLAYRF